MLGVRMSGGTTVDHDAFVALCARMRSMGAIHVRSSGLEARWASPPEDDKPRQSLLEAQPLTRSEREDFNEMKRQQRMEEELP